MKQVVILVLFATLAAAQWRSPKSAMDAYDFVQDRRSAAEKLWEKKDPAGIEMLQTTLAYLDMPLVRDLPSGNQYLAARRLNIEIDLAQAYARCLAKILSGSFRARTGHWPARTAGTRDWRKG